LIYLIIAQVTRVDFIIEDLHKLLDQDISFYILLHFDVQSRTYRLSMNRQTHIVCVRTKLRNVRIKSLIMTSSPVIVYWF